jgi:hypothetical protein
MAIILDKHPVWMRRFGLIGLLCALVSPGCAQRHETMLLGPLPPIGARFTVLHPPHVPLLGTSSSAREEYNYEADFGTFKFEALGPRLKVDRRDYGELPRDADVVIDARREEIKVSVNGVERTPIEKPQRD